MEGRGAAFVPAGSSAFGVPVASSAATGYVFSAMDGRTGGVQVGRAGFLLSLPLLFGRCHILDDRDRLTRHCTFAALYLVWSVFVHACFVWCATVARMP